MMTSGNRSAVRSAAITYASFAVPISMVGVYWPDVRGDLDRSLGDLGLVSLVYGLARMSTALTGRPLVSRLGMGAAFVATLAVLAGSCLAVAAAPTWPVFLAAIAGVGAASGSLDSLGAVFVTAIENVSSAGLIHGMYGFGATIGPLAVVLAPGWRWSALAAAGAVLVALAVATQIRDQWPSTAPIASPRGGGSGPVAATPRFTVVGSLGAFASLVALEVTTGQWAFTYLTDHRSVGEELAAVGVSGFWAGLMMGRLLLARPTIATTVDRWGTVPFIVTSFATLAATAVLPAIAAVGALCLTGLLLGPLVPTLFARTTQRVGEVMAARMAGRQLLATNVGAIGVPTLTGFLVDEFGAGVIIIVMLTIVGALALPLLALLKHIAPVDRADRSLRPQAADS